MLKKKMLVLAVFAIIFVLSTAQDIQLSQYYNTAQFMNPAFVGSSHAFRSVINKRTQWPGLDAKYNTMFLSADYNLNKLNSGFGGHMVVDRQGSSVIRSSEAALQYATWVNINYEYSLRVGLQLGYHNKRLDYSQLTTPSTYNPNSFSYSYINPDDLDIDFKSTSFLDIGSGLLLYSDHFWFGYALYHVDKPSYSFMVEGAHSHVDFRHDFIGGYKFKTNIGKKANLYSNNFIITPTFLYKRQGKADQLDLGTYLNYMSLMLGVWYRGIPIKNYNNQDHRAIINNESIIFLLGTKFDYFTISYSYDFVISKLSRTSMGAHEINLIFVYPSEEEFVFKNKKFKALPCPKIQKEKRKREKREKRKKRN
jgi:type IX secretion system PorP/SprF family membrane protein